MQFVVWRPKAGRPVFACALLTALFSLCACQTTPPPVIGTVSPAIAADQGQETFSGVGAGQVTLNPGDKVSVTVFREPDLSVTALPIGGDGTLSLPLIGTFPASGRSPGELGQEIQARFAEQGYLRNPQVAVNLTELGSYKVTVEGGVTNPGVYDFVPGQRLSSAVALAAGPKRTAKLDQVALFRRTADGMSVAKFDYSAIQQGTMLDPVLVPGDRVVMGTSKLGQIWQDLLQSLPVFAIFSNI